nr:acyl-CoA dehydrogenase family protein [Streptomyces sp. SID5914]
MRQRAEKLVPQLRERGRESEELRKLPDATVADLEAAEILQAMRPASAGGSEIGLQTFVDVTRTLSRGDASAGWVTAFYMSHAWVLSKLGTEAQKAIFADRPTALAAGTISQPGSAQRADAGYRVTGRWRFASGIMHAEWLMALALAEDGPLICILPVASVTIHDTWHVPGMKATGSNDAEAQDVFVPAYLAVPFDVFLRPDCPGALAYDYPLLRYPVSPVLSLIHPAVALGVADAALELFRDAIESRLRIPSLTRVIEEPTTHEIYAEAVDEHRCAELCLRDAVEILDAGTEGEGPGPALEQRAELNLAIAASGERAFRAVDLLIRGAGAGVHRTGHPLDRICRDTQVMRNHTVVDWRHKAAVCGRVLLGQGGDQPDALF